MLRVLTVLRVLTGADGADGADGQDFVTAPRNNLQPLVNLFGEFRTISATNLLNSAQIVDSTSTAGVNFQLAGSVDGAGMVVDPNDPNKLILMTNCEDHYSVARLVLARFDNVVPDGDGFFDQFDIIKADYMVNSSIADFSRMCSGTMWETAIHGGTEDFFIASAESFNFTSRRVNVSETPDPDNNSDDLTALGQLEWENNVPLPQNAYPGETVIIGGDDDSSTSTGLGQVALYHSTNGDADFTNGGIYVLRFDTATTISDESDIDFGVDYAVEFVEIENGASLTQAEMGQACIDSLAFQFMRVEDLDYGKGSDEAARTIYFAVTGRGPGRGTFNDWGTGYRLVLDPTNPLVGTMTQILSGNTNTNNRDGNLGALQSPDNICVTENFIYWQEDPNSFSRGHQAYIWQTDLNGDNAKAVLELQFDPSLEQVEGVRESDVFDGEFGAMFDISDKVNEDGTFILNLQPHYWINEAFQGIDGHDLGIPPGFPGEDWQGSQIIVLRNVPR